MKAKLNNYLIFFYIHFLKRLYGFSKISTKLIYAQAWHETGNFKSQVFKDNKNLFGMRQPKVRKTTAVGSRHNHALYKSYFDSVRDYFLRQKNFKIDNTGDNQFIIDTVKSGYAEDQDYERKWRNIVETINYPNVLIVQASFFLLMLITYFLISKTLKNDE